MKTILEIITPIKLLAGSHKDTAKTGQGCAMNVIAYLNGEAQITDHSPCVCVTVRKPLIWFNDYLKDDERQELVPYLLRAMGSSTEDKTVINARLVHVVKFASSMGAIAKRAAAASSSYTAANYAATADYIAANTNAAYAANAATADYIAAAASAANYATTAASYAAAAAASAADYAAARKEIKVTAFAFLDAVLPPLIEPSQAIISRAQELVELSK